MRRTAYCDGTRVSEAGSWDLMVFLFWWQPAGLLPVRVDGAFGVNLCGAQNKSYISFILGG